MENFFPRKTSFVLGSTEHGPMIFNRHDYRLLPDGGGFGVGLQLMEFGAYDPAQCQATLQMLALRREHFGDGVVAVDVGANVGAFALTWGRTMQDWGFVLAFEPQEPLFYALAGNIVLNNLQNNVRAQWAALGATNGNIDVPVVDYDRPSSFGSLELREGPKTENIGQKVDYSNIVETPLLTLDGHLLKRLDLLKIDVEGMELEVLAGAMGTLERCKPLVIAEQIKTDSAKLRDVLGCLDYIVHEMGMDLLAVHEDDPLREAIRT